jgi:MerR family transcriptional regulator, mercuric resistance operon regulatory protein
MRVGQLAKAVGVSVETVRYYQRIGLLPVPKNMRGIRRYADLDLARLRFIRRAQQLGFSLDDIRTLLRLSRADCQDVQSIAHGKLDSIREKIQDLSRMQGVLEDALRQCARRKPHQGCPIIESLNAKRGA